MSDDTFRLFPEEKQSSPGDAVVQFLINEQNKGNKRFTSAMESVFPGFGKAIDKVTSGAEERRQQLNKVFGLKLGEPITKEAIESSALGFGVGAIKGITGVPRLGVMLGGKEITRPRKFSIGGVQELKKAKQAVTQTGQDVSQFAPFTEGTTQELKFVGGQKPPAAFLEAGALIDQVQKQIQTKVKATQKDLNARLISEVNPLVPTDLVKELRTKGLKATAGFNEGEGVFYVAFKSTKAIADDLTEFGIVETESGPVLSVNFNSPTIKPELRAIFKEKFGDQFLDDYIESEAAPAQLQRMSGETSENAPLPANLSFYGVKDFDDGLRLINRMTDIITGPETIKEAAIKIGDKVFTGQIHADAFDAAQEKGFVNFKNVEGGFITSTGRFVGRVEAQEIAKKNDQLKSGLAETRLLAEELLPAGKGLGTKDIPTDEN